MATREQLAAYSASSDALRKSAVGAVHKQLKAYLGENPTATVSEIREWAKAMLGELCERYSVSAEAVASDFYEELTGAPAQASASLVDYDAIDRAVRYQASKLVDGRKADFIDGCARYLGEVAVNKTVNRSMINQVILGKRKRGRKRYRGQSGIRWFRVPGGAEPCTFCVMLASRKDGYTSKESAGGTDPDHFHSGCKCKVIPANSAAEIEGFDPDEYGAIWARFREIDSYGLPRAQEEALKYAHLDRVRPQGGRVQQQPIDFADALESAARSAWSSFAKDKTIANYQGTVANFIGLLASEYGVEWECKTSVNAAGTTVYARPNGDELWVASKLAKKERYLAFLPADQSYTPDVETSTGFAEIKCPSSASKVSARLRHAKVQLEARSDGLKTTYLGLHRMKDVSRARAIAVDLAESGQAVNVQCVLSNGGIEEP